MIEDSAKLLLGIFRFDSRISTGLLGQTALSPQGFSRFWATVLRAASGGIGFSHDRSTWVAGVSPRNDITRARLIHCVFRLFLVGMECKRLRRNARRVSRETGVLKRGGSTGAGRMVSAAISAWSKR
jgi:hypothetical protein